MHFLLQAFPSISTGIYGYPVPDATHVALGEVRRFLDTHSEEVSRQWYTVSPWVQLFAHSWSVSSLLYGVMRTRMYTSELYSEMKQ